jgi:hypothetical protein
MDLLYWAPLKLPDRAPIDAHVLRLGLFVWNVLRGKNERVIAPTPCAAGAHRFPVAASTGQPIESDVTNRVSDTNGMRPQTVEAGFGSLSDCFGSVLHDSSAPADRSSFPFYFAQWLKPFLYGGWNWRG